MESIVPAEQRTAEFYGEELIALRDGTGAIWVPLRRLCEAIGVAFPSQLTKVTQDPVMSEHLRRAPVTLADGRTYEMECLALKYVRGWLFSINANRVKSEVRDRLIQYQREVIEILDRTFSRDLPAQRMDDAMILAMRDNAMQQAQLWEMVLAERQRLRVTEELVQEHDDRLGDHDRHLWRHDQALDQALEELGALRQRQGDLLAHFSDITRLLPASSEQIGPAQKAAIKALVDDIVAAAQAKGVRLGQGRNDYPATWDAFKRRFDLAKYDELTLAQYEEAVAWLKGWLDQLRS
jgi:hypothetical protein